MLQHVGPSVSVGGVERQKPLSAGELSRQRARLEEKEKALTRKELELQEKERELVQRERGLLGESLDSAHNSQPCTTNISLVREKALLEKQRQLKKPIIIPAVYYKPHHPAVHHKPHHHHQ